MTCHCLRTSKLMLTNKLQIESDGRKIPAGLSGETFQRLLQIINLVEIRR